MQDVDEILKEKVGRRERSSTFAPFFLMTNIYLYDCCDYKGKRNFDGSGRYSEGCDVM
jgi:hypothetical protein